MTICQRLIPIEVTKCNETRATSIKRKRRARELLIMESLILAQDERWRRA